MMNVKLLAVVTPASIYRGCSTQKTLLEEKFTAENNFTLCEFSAANMKTFSLSNVSKHREIKGSDKYVTLDISLKFDSLGNMSITYSESKVKLGRSVKGLISFLCNKAKTRPKKY